MPLFRRSKILGVRQARNFTTNVPKLLDLNLSHECHFGDFTRVLSTPFAGNHQSKCIRLYKVF